MRQFATVIRTHAHRLIADESAATAIEYAIIASGIASAIAAIIATLGSSVVTMWTTVKDAFG